MGTKPHPSVYGLSVAAFLPHIVCTKAELSDCDRDYVWPEI